MLDHLNVVAVDTMAKDRCIGSKEMSRFRYRSEAI